MTDMKGFAADAAKRLYEAEKSRKQIRMLSLEHPNMTMNDAYDVQSQWIELKKADGRVIKGYKIGLTSKAMQAAVGIKTPDTGIILDDMVYWDGAEVPHERFIAPRVEVELAFVMKHRLAGPGCTIHDVLLATEFVQPAFEILDTRIFRVDPESGATRTVMDTIADNAANGALVLGGRPVRPQEVDMRWLGSICMRNGQVEETGLAAGVLNHPAYGIAWLANRLGSMGGALEAGQLVLSGSFVRPVESSPGDTFIADFGKLGTVSFAFIQEDR